LPADPIAGSDASGVGHVSTYARDSGLGVDAPGSIERAAHEERWSLPVATLFIVSTSLALWTGIFFMMNLVVG